MANRLSKESSPYLLQHAGNPVNWFPWGDEALNLSREEDKPIFLSVGYSACHWCHVMEHESFENNEIATFLNEHFVSIKVDREERPDLDQIYMQAVMALQRGQGGWPLSAFLTPDCHVFFGGTYWPAHDSRGMPGFDRVLRSVLDAFQNRRTEVTEQSAKVTEYLNSQQAPASNATLSNELLFQAGESLERIFDFKHGGFGQSPKFPHSMDLQVLMRLFSHESKSNGELTVSENRWMKMVCLNLDKMALGGIYDHLGGAFARYSVDEKWLVPHFEKMLYDNGLLMDAYLDAFLITGKPLYERVLRETFEYQLTYMTDVEGGFHSTEDADSEGEEGKFYVWTPEEICEVLGAVDGEQFCQVYDVTKSGNFEGNNILNLKIPLEEYSRSCGIDESKFLDKMRKCREQLLEIRDQRIRPGKDDKILVSWNSLMISSMARAGVVLAEQRYLTAAAAAADFIFEKMTGKDGELLHTYRNGEAKIEGYLDDYSYFINALITLSECDGDSRWLQKAIELTDIVVRQFQDESAGAFFFTSANAEKLITRNKEFQDSSVPSGNSVMATALARVSQLTGDERYLELATQTAQNAYDLILRAPSASGQMLCAIDGIVSNGRQIVVAADNDHIPLILRLIHQNYDPNRTISVAPLENQTRLVDSVLLNGKTMIDKQPTVYVCENFTCESPLIGLKMIETYFQKEPHHHD